MFNMPRMPFPPGRKLLVGVLAVAALLVLPSIATPVGKIVIYGSHKGSTLKLHPRGHHHIIVKGNMAHRHPQGCHFTRGHRRCRLLDPWRRRDRSRHGPPRRSRQGDQAPADAADRPPRHAARTSSSATASATSASPKAPAATAASAAATTTSASPATRNSDCVGGPRQRLLPPRPRQRRLLGRPPATTSASWAQAKTAATAAPATTASMAAPAPTSSTAARASTTATAG